MDDRITRLKRIQEISFTLNDLMLYLDTHPLDTDALDAFSQAQAQRRELMANYARDFEPLTIDCVCQKHFNWSDGPLPWDNQGGA